MKKLIIAYLFTITNVFAAPPTYFNGELQTNTYIQNIKAPNYQTTPLGGIDRRLETGNMNELQNPSFEHTTVTTGWTVSNATSSSSTTRIEGSKSLSLALTGALSLSQSSTINAAQKSGVQMVASIWVNSSDVSDLQLCSLKNGSEDKCTVTGGYVQGSGWRQLTVSFLGDSTSNGLKLKSTDTTGTVLVDQAYVGIGSPVVDFTPDMVYSAEISATGVVSSENTEWLNGNCTISNTAQFDCPIISGLITDKLNCVPQRVGTGFNDRVPAYDFSNSSNTNLRFRTSDTTNGAASVGAFSVVCQKQGADYKTSKAYVASSSDYDWTAYTPTLGAGFGTTSNVSFFHKKSGSNLFIKGTFTIGTTSASLGTISLPGSLTIDTSKISINNTVSNPGGIIGVFSGTATSNYGSIVTATGTNTSLVYLATNTNGSSLLTPQNVSGFLTSSTLISVWFTVPIQGWTDSGVIVGSFEGIEKCANDYECTDTFSATILPTGVVEYENIPWIASTSSAATGRRQLTYRSILKDGVNPLTSPMNCNVTMDGIQVGGQDYSATIRTNTSALIDIDLKYIAVGGINAKFYISCSKNAQDYKPKTAKIASSIGVPTVPGVTTQAIDTFSVSYGTTNATTVCSASPCSYLDQIGNAVTSITRSTTGTYSLNTSKTYSKLKCQVGYVPGASWGSQNVINCSNCNTQSFQTVTTAPALADSFGTLICQGIPQ